MATRCLPRSWRQHCWRLIVIRRRRKRLLRSLSRRRKRARQQPQITQQARAHSEAFPFIRSLPRRLPPLPEGSVCIPAKARGSPSVTLVLDLDETLVHSSTADEGLAYDLAFDVPFGAVTHRVRVLKRPHVDEFLKRVSQLFEIVVFTASDRAYADRLLTLLDPQRRISHRVFRDSCTQFEGSYLKDLRVLGRDLAQTAIVDNSPEAFGLQIANGIPIESWLDDPSDTELLKLLPFLESMASAHDVRPLLRKRFNLHELVYGAKGALRR